MSKFFNKLKHALSKTHRTLQVHVVQNNQVSFYQQRIQRIASRTRAILGSIMNKLLQLIYREDQRFKLVSNDPMQFYIILKLIGNKVIEVQCLKICIFLLKKIQNNAAKIAINNGGTRAITTEVEWFQCVLWYRKVKNQVELDDFFNFTCQFFKTDLTRRISSDSELFTMNPILKYFGRYQILPLYQILFYLEPYVTFNIPKPTVDAIFQLNKQQIRNSVSLNQNNSNIPKSFQIDQLYPEDQQEKTYNQNSSYQSPPENISFKTNAPNINTSNYNIPYNPINNINSNFNQNNPLQMDPTARFVDPLYPMGPVNPIGNPFGQSYSGNTFNLPSSQFGNPFTIPPPTYNYDNAKYHFFYQNQNNSNINQQSQFNFSQPQYTYNQQTQPQGFKGFEPQSYEKQQEQIQRKNKQAEQALKKANELRKREEEQSRKKQLQFEQVQREKTEREKQEKRILEMLKDQREKQELERLKKEKERKQAQERELAAKRAVQEKQRKEKEEQLKKEMEEERRQRQREERMNQRQREQEHQLNVFVDNERESIDRGFSGRFSSNMGFKFDFAEEEAQQFAQSKTQCLNNPLFINPALNDEDQSIRLIQEEQITQHKPFKLFFFKHGSN